MTSAKGKRGDDFMSILEQFILETRGVVRHNGHVQRFRVLPDIFRVVQENEEMTDLPKENDPRYITKEVLMARFLFSKEYSRQNLGQVGFYESLNDCDKKIVANCVDEIENCDLRAKK